LKKIFRCQSKFNDIIVVDTASWGKCLILNNELQSAEADQQLYHRALCFSALTQATKHILVLGGGEGSTAKMILNADPDKRVVMVEIDQMVVDVCKEQIPSMGGSVWENPRLKLIIDDAFTFVEQCTEKFDAVISDLSSPTPNSTSDPLYTAHFYSKVRGILKPNGLFVMQATHRPSRYWEDFQSAFPKHNRWSEWIPSFAVPWHFFGGIYEPKIKLEAA